MSECIEDLQEFVKAAENHFWNSHPAAYHQFCRFLGDKIQAVKSGTLDEAEYTEQWRNTPPELKEASNEELPVPCGYDHLPVDH